MSATLSISPFSNFLIITNILHNYVLYAFLFFHSITSSPLIINFLIVFISYRKYKIFSYTTCETTPDLIFYIISITFEQSEVLASVYQPYLYLPRPVSRRHPMDIGRRAKQFAPFAALRGLDETVRQQEILYEPRKILSEEKQNELDMKLNILTCDRKIQVTYFVRSQKNPLIGQYHTIMGTVKFFDSSSYLRIDDITPLLLRDSSSQ